MEQNPTNVFEWCRELNKHGFPQKKNDSGWYFVTPEVMVMMRDLDDLKEIDGRTTINFDRLIYYPKTADFVEYLGNDLQQVIRSNASGWFAYTNSTHGGGITSISAGETMWMALARAVWVRYLEKDQAMPPMFNIEDSENVQEGQEPPI